MAMWNTLQRFNELTVSELETFKWIYFKINMGEPPKSLDGWMDKDNAA